MGRDDRDAKSDKMEAERDSLGQLRSWACCLLGLARAQSGQKGGAWVVCVSITMFVLRTSMENGNIEGVDAADGRVHKCVGLAADVSPGGEKIGRGAKIGQRGSPGRRYCRTLGSSLRPGRKRKKKDEAKKWKERREEMSQKGQKE
jgi:hypothetical protein